MPYDPATTSNFCRSCGINESFGHSTSCWKNDVVKCSDVTATLIKYCIVREKVEIEEELSGEIPTEEGNVVVCTHCGRGRPSTSTVDCFCGAQDYKALPVEDAENALREWCEKNKCENLLEEGDAILENRTPRPEAEEDEEEDTDDTSSEESK